MKNEPSQQGLKWLLFHLNKRFELEENNWS